MRSKFHSTYKLVMVGASLLILTGCGLLHENQSPIVSIDFHPSSPRVGDLIVLEGSNSYDPDGYLTEFTWYIERPEINYYYQTTGSRFTWSACWEGNYAITLTVKDNHGVMASDTKYLWVNPLPENYVHPGDILYHPAVYSDLANQEIAMPPEGIIVATITGHVGIVDCQFRVVEAEDEGIINSYYVSDFVERYSNSIVPKVYVLRVITSVPVRALAVYFAHAQIGKPYSYDYFSKEIFDDAYYCSELVWAAYQYASGAYVDDNGTVYCGYINLDAGDGSSCTDLPVTPNEIYRSDWTYTVGVLYP